MDMQIFFTQHVGTNLMNGRCVVVAGFLFPSSLLEFKNNYIEDLF